jgi:hypothetical protein
VGNIIRFDADEASSTAVINTKRQDGNSTALTFPVSALRALDSRAAACRHHLHMIIPFCDQCSGARNFN